MADNTTKIVITARDDTSAALQSAKRNLETLGQAAEAAGIRMGAGGLIGAATAVGIALAGMTKVAIDAADDMNDLSQRVGVSIRELAGYKLAAEQSGASLESVAKGVKGLATYMSEHADALKAAGINAKTTDEAMVQLADVFAGLPDGLEKSALATKLFGKAGQDLIPMLNLGRQGLKEAKDKADEYGRKMAEIAPQADKFNDIVRELGLQSKIAGLDLASYLLPTLVSIADNFNKARQAGLGFTEALTGIGVRDANESQADARNNAGAHIKALMAERDQVRSQLASMGDFDKALGENKKFDERLAKIEKLLKYYRSLQAETANQSDYSNEGLRSGSSSGLSAEDQAKALLGKAEAAKAANSAYESLIKSIREKTAIEQAEADVGQPLTETQKLRVELETRLDEVLGKSNTKKREAAQAEIDRLVDLKSANDAQAEWIKFQEAADKANAERLSSLVKQAEALELEAQTYGLTKSQIEATTLARLEENRAIVLAHGATEEQLRALDEEIAARKRIQEALKSVEGKQAMADAEKQAARDWEKFTDDIERSLTDALMRGFENGQSFGENFVESLKNTLKTAALRIVVQAIVDPVMGTLKGVLGSGGVAGSGGSLLSTASSLSNFSMTPFGNAFGNVALSSFGETLGLSSTIGNDQFGNAVRLLSSNGQALNSAAGFMDSYGGYLSAAYSLANGDAGSAIGAAVGQYFGGPIGAAIGSTLLGGLFGGGGEDPHNNAQVNGYIFGLNRNGVVGLQPAEFGGNGGNQPLSFSAGPTSGSGWWADSYAMPSSAVATLNDQVVAIFSQAESIAGALGIGKDKLNSVSVNSAANGTAGNGKIGSYFSSIDQAIQALQDSIAKALIPTIQGFQKSGESLSQALGRLATNVVSVDSWGARLGFSLKTYAQKNLLVDAFGSADVMGSALSSYYQNFYSESERQKSAKADIDATLKSLGLSSIPATREQFRALVGAQNLATDSGRKMFSALIAVSGAFAGVTDSAVATTKSLSTSGFRSRVDYLRALNGNGESGGMKVSDPVLRKEIATLRQEFNSGLISLARYTSETSRILNRWNGDGMPEQRTVTA